ncbi:MAG: maleylpyruvate isomerase family mycothiol-dependent enzyme [Actinomycetota bacterium]
MGDIDRVRVVAAMGEVWASLSELLGELPDADWELPSPLPGWSVHDNVAHIIGTEAMLLGEPSPEVTVDRDRLTHVRNDIGEFNEVWIEHLRSSSPADVLARFRDHTDRRLDALRSMTDEEWNADSFTPAGPGTYGRFMQIRVFDCWLHEQDIRDTVGRPGHERGLAVDVTLDELEQAMGFVVGKRAQAPDGSTVRLDLTDGDDLARTIAVEIDGRARVVDTPPSTATVTLRLPVGVLTRRCAGRVEATDVRDQVEILGDVELGDRVFDALPYTI